MRLVVDIRVVEWFEWRHNDVRIDNQSRLSRWCMQIWPTTTTMFSSFFPIYILLNQHDTRIYFYFFLFFFFFFFCFPFFFCLPNCHAFYITWNSSKWFLYSRFFFYFLFIYIHCSLTIEIFFPFSQYFIIRILLYFLFDLNPWIYIF